MRQMLAIEWIKLRWYSTFWGFLLFFAIAVYAVNYFAFSTYHHQFEGMPAGNLKGQLFSFPEVWQTTSYISGFLLFIPVMLFILLVTNEIELKTQRQHIIDGVMRKNYIVAKMAIVLIVCGVLTCIVGSCAFVFGTCTDSSFDPKGMVYLLYFYLQAVSYCSLALFFAVAIKKTGLAIATFIVYAWIFEKSVAGMLNSKWSSAPGTYLPLNVSDKLIPIPLNDTLAGLYTGTNDLSVLLTLTSFYILVFYLLTLYFLNSEDL